MTYNRLLKALHNRLEFLKDHQQSLSCTWWLLRYSIRNTHHGGSVEIFSSFLYCTCIRPVFQSAQKLKFLINPTLCFEFRMDLSWPPQWQNINKKTRSLSHHLLQALLSVDSAVAYGLKSLKFSLSFIAKASPARHQFQIVHPKVLYNNPPADHVHSNLIFVVYVWPCHLHVEAIKWKLSGFLGLRKL